MPSFRFFSFRVGVDGTQEKRKDAAVSSAAVSDSKRCVHRLRPKLGCYSFTAESLLIPATIYFSQKAKRTNSGTTMTVQAAMMAPHLRP